MRRRSLAAAAGLLMPTLAGAQGLGGGRPIRLIVPYSPGGATDILSRLLTPRLAEILGQTVVVESGRIVQMGPSDSIRVPRRAMKIDGRGRFLMPGLADMHVHFIRSALPAQPARSGESSLE